MGPSLVEVKFKDISLEGIIIIEPHSGILDIESPLAKAKVAHRLIKWSWTKPDSPKSSLRMANKFKLKLNGNVPTTITS